MTRIRVLTDSTADVPDSIASQMGIAVVPAYVQIGDASLRDGVDISREEFYRRLPGLARVPTTAVPPADDFTAAFRRLSGAADEVIAVLVSATLSGMLGVARLGSADVPDLTVHLVDSQQVMMGLGWQAILAAEDAAAGRSSAEILAHIHSVQPRVRIFGVLDTLEYLRRGGRVDWARTTAARLLHIKPLIEFVQGKAVLVGQVRTRRRAIDRLIEIIADLGPLERLALIHTAAPDWPSFRDRLGELVPVERILVSEVGPTVGTHLGPSALGVALIIAAQEPA